MNKQLKDQEKNDALRSVAEHAHDEAIRQAARIMGAIGGRAGRGDAKRRTPEICRQAVAVRWENYRRRKASKATQDPIS